MIFHTLSRRASSRHYILRKELPPSMFFIDALLHHNIFPLQHWVQRRGALMEALFRISEGYFFGPHHLIMAALLYFEEKVHWKKLLRADAIPLLFPMLLCQILEHLGYPAEPQHERRRICWEIFTLDKWTGMTAYDGADQGVPVGPEHPEQQEKPVDILLTLSHRPLQWPLLSLYQRFHPLLLRPHHRILLLFHLSQSHILQLSQG